MLLTGAFFVSVKGKTSNYNPKIILIKEKPAQGSCAGFLI